MTASTHRKAPEGLRVAGGLGPPIGQKHGATTAWRAAIDISERADAYVVTVEIPGVTADEVEITMEDGRLTIPGERHAAREGRTEASARDTVLEILVPKAPEAQARHVRIHAGWTSAILTPGHHDEER